MPPTDRFVARFAAEPPQETLPTGRWAERLGISELTQDPDGTTVLSGIAADQAVLHGLLQRIRDLGLPLISVLRIDPNSQS